MSKALKEELELPEEASLDQNPPWVLETTQGKGSIPISPETCLNKDACCLLVGRQASTADIRIQHGSISRKHAVFYNLKDGSLHLKDLGGKHGTHVNGRELNGSTQLKNADRIYFGNVQASSFVVKKPETRAGGSDGGKEDTANAVEPPAPTQQQDDTVQVESTAPEPGQGLTGRAKREAEIAAMMASLDEKPSYEKYVAPKQEQQLLAEESQASKIATQYSLPVSERFDILSDEKRVITCLAVDPAGSRFAVGGTDTHLRMFDFAGMDSVRTDPFKTIEVQDGHPVVDVCYSNTGDRLLVATGSVQPKVLDRDGNEVIQFVRGDMYVTDQARTSGHTAGITGVDWHPFERDTVLTSSMDGSARLWDLNGKTQFHMLVCDKVYRAKNAKGQRVGVTAVAFHPGGREFVLGTACGSIQIWNATRVGARPEKVVFHSHGEGRPVNSLSFNLDGSQIVSRSEEDDKVKVWESRRLSRSCKPAVTCEGLATVHERSNAVFSPDGGLVCAGSSEFRKGSSNERIETGSLKLFLGGKADSSSEQKPGALLLELPAPNGVGIVTVSWHSKLNQIFVCCSDGRVCVYFDPSISSKGALLTSSKIGCGPDELSQLLAARAPQGSAAIAGEIITPHALPIFRNETEKNAKRKREKERLDPVKSRKPEPPAEGKFKQGSQSGASVSFSQFVANSSIQSNKIIAGRDPREELLKYQEGKSYTSKAYEGDQPNPLEEKTLEEEEEAELKRK